MFFHDSTGYQSFVWKENVESLFWEQYLVIHLPPVKWHSPCLSQQTLISDEAGKFWFSRNLIVLREEILEAPMPEQSGKALHLSVSHWAVWLAMTPPLLVNMFPFADWHKNFVNNSFRSVFSQRKQESLVHDLSCSSSCTFAIPQSHYGTRTAISPRPQRSMAVTLSNPSSFERVITHFFLWLMLRTVSMQLAVYSMDACSLCWDVWYHLAFARNASKVKKQPRFYGGHGVTTATWNVGQQSKRNAWEFSTSWTAVSAQYVAKKLDVTCWRLHWQDFPQSGRVAHFKSLKTKKKDNKMLAALNLKPRRRFSQSSSFFMNSCKTWFEYTTTEKQPNLHITSPEKLGLSGRSLGRIPQVSPQILPLVSVFENDSF